MSKKSDAIADNNSKKISFISAMLITVGRLFWSRHFF